MNEKSMEVYRGLLVEIKYRTAVIDEILAAKLPLRARIAEELCYLQLRMICEIIAICCLIIHGTISAKKTDLLKSYKADWIVKELEKLHPKFFLTPLEREDDKSVMPHGWIHKTSGFLTHKELSKLWSEHTGNYLHRGGAKKVLDGTERAPNFKEIAVWRDKIVELLTRHTVISPDEKTICYFIMNDGQDRVHSARFQLVEGASSPQRYQN